MSEDLKMKFIQELSKGNVSIGQLIMEVHGDNHYYEKDYQPKTGKATTKDAAQESVSSELMVNALKQCRAYIWGNSAYAVAFCLCRDRYQWQDNGSYFETLMEEQGMECPKGTIAATFYNNKYMKMHIDKWKNAQVPKRVMLLVNQLEMAVDKQLETTIP